MRKKPKEKSQNIDNDLPFYIVNEYCQFFSGLHKGGRVKWSNEINQARIFKRSEIFITVRMNTVEKIEKIYV